MYVTDEQWNEIIEATKTGIDRWNASAAKHGATYRYSFEVWKPNDNFVMLQTEQKQNSGNRYTHEIARETATGELRNIKLKYSKSRKTRGQIIGFVVKPDPKSWATLANKPAPVIVKQLKLLDYIVVTSVRPVLRQQAHRLTITEQTGEIK
jgi:hypothetical protein